MDDLGAALARSDGVYVFRGGGIVVREGYGDASPAGTGNIDVAPDGEVTYRAGKWRPAEVARSSNWKEMRTVLSRLEAEVRTQRETGSQRAAASAEQRTGSAEQGAAAAAAAACRDQANGRAPMTPRR